MEPRLLFSAYMVTNTLDAGPGSLRQAMLDANAHAGADTIAFSIGSGPQTIAAAAALPALSDPVVIDGTTQPGFAGKPLVEVTAFGIEINGGHSTVRGLIFGGADRATGFGLYLHGGGGNVVQGNYFGVDAGGETPIGGASDLCIENSSANLIGGTAPGDGNLISGRGGVDVVDDDEAGVLKSFAADGLSDDNVIQGNLIGTDANGNFAPGLGNETGIDVAGGHNLLIGGTTPGARNVISGNDDDIILGDDTSPGIKIQGNYIGTNAAGTAALGERTTGHGELGIWATSYVPGTLIGGTEPGAGNLISGCTRDGIVLGDAGAIVQGNLIGTDYTGTRALSGSQVQYSGISIYEGTNNLIGGAAPGAANAIAFNQYSGVAVYPDSLGNQVISNSIFGNGQLGIDLKGDGPTPNTPGGPHDGPNHFQNFPVLTSAATSAAGTTVTGTLDSSPNATFHVELFSNPQADPSGFGQGQTLLGSVSVTTDASGAGSFTFTTTARVPAGRVLSATATSASGDTSEFSADLLVRLAGDVTGDGKVDFSDLLILAQHYGRQGGLAEGDLTGDGRIDFSDLLTLAQNYGLTSADEVARRRAARRLVR